MTSVPAPAQTSSAVRRLLALAAVLVFIIGIPLYVASTATETFFAWTIATPLTAAFLGASYWSSGILELLASRRTRWCDARIAVPAVLLFTVLTLVVTIVHLDRFHFGAESTVTLAVTWAWLLVYAIVPVLMVFALVLQRGSSGSDPPRTSPLPRRLRGMLAAQGIMMIVVGLPLLLAPVKAGSLWPWSLTPLTARAIGVWLISLGVAALHSCLENDQVRIRPAAISYIVLVVLQLIALARFPGDFAWGTSSGLLYLGFLVWMLALGVALNSGSGARADLRGTAA